MEAALFSASPPLVFLRPQAESYSLQQTAFRATADKLRLSLPLRLIQSVVYEPYMTLAERVQIQFDSGRCPYGSDDDRSSITSTDSSGDSVSSVSRAPTEVEFGYLKSQLSFPLFFDQMTTMLTTLYGAATRLWNHYKNTSRRRRPFRPAESVQSSSSTAKCGQAATRFRKRLPRTRGPSPPDSSTRSLSTTAHRTSLVSPLAPLPHRHPDTIFPQWPRTATL